MDAGDFSRSRTTVASSLAANADNAIRDVIVVITVFIENLMPVGHICARDYKVSGF
jgi:hypothetical protein